MGVILIFFSFLFLSMDAWIGIFSFCLKWLNNGNLKCLSFLAHCVFAFQVCHIYLYGQGLGSISLLWYETGGSLGLRILQHHDMALIIFFIHFKKCLQSHVWLHKALQACRCIFEHFWRDKCSFILSQYLYWGILFQKYGYILHFVHVAQPCAQPYYGLPG